jgi:glucose/arabinose dehydrogenase
MVFYDQDLFPAAYRGGVFLAFHGSWNRSPMPQAGYRVVFVPFAQGQATGEYQTFATLTGHATGLRATGVAVAPDGALFIGGDANGQIWRVIPAPN